MMPEIEQQQVQPLPLHVLVVGNDEDDQQESLPLNKLQGLSLLEQDKEELLLLDTRGCSDDSIAAVSTTSSSGGSNCSSNSSTASSTPTSSPTTRSKTRRCVQFTSVPPQIHCLDQTFTPEEKPLLWYSKADLEAFHSAEKEHVQAYTSDVSPQYISQLLQLWTCPCNNVDVQRKLVAPIADTPVRGLEKLCLKQVMRQRRETVLKRVLQAQQNCVWLDNNREDEERRMELLRQECEPLARTSVRFAKAMAEADAMAVAAMR